MNALSHKQSRFLPCVVVFDGKVGKSGPFAPEAIEQFSINKMLNVDVFLPGHVASSKY